MTRRAALLLLLTAAPAMAAPLAEPAPVDVLAADTEARWVLFELTPGNQIRFAMALDGRSITAILDTGASHSLLSRRSAALRPARLRSGGVATAIGGDVALEWMPTERIELAGLTRTGGGVSVADLPVNATGSAVPIDLLVGRDLLAGQALEIDYPARRFRLLRSGRLPFRGTPLPLAVSPQRLVYESEVTLGGHRLAPMMIDTGDGASLTLARASWDRVAPPGLRTTTTLGYGVAGALVNDLAIVPDVGIGTAGRREVEVRIEPAGGFSAALGVAGRIGSGLLQRYRVLLDPGAGRMLLGPAAAAPPPLRSTSGLLVEQAGDRLRVLHVMRGGPGEVGGWRTGDTICAVDSRPIAAGYAASRQARWTVAPPGTTVRLGDCTGGERALVARAFY